MPPLIGVQRGTRRCGLRHKACLEWPCCRCSRGDCQKIATLCRRGRPCASCSDAPAAQFVIAALLLGFPQARVVFEAVGGAVRGLQEATLIGVRFVFGDLRRRACALCRSNACQRLHSRVPGAAADPYHERALARALSLGRVASRGARHRGRAPQGLGVSGPLGTAAAAKVFVGMVEAPLLIRPYLAQLGRGELFALMTVGMATVAGTVFALYAAILERWCRVRPGMCSSRPS